MADNEEIIGIGSEDEEETEDHDLNEGEDNDSGIGEGVDKASPKRESLGRFGWIILSLLGVFAAVIVVMGVLFGPEVVSRFTRQDLFTQIDMPPSSLSEEILSPFFILMPSGSEYSLIRIDLSTVWDGLASVRYTKIKLQIRNDLYEYFKDMVAQKENDLENMSIDLETGVQEIICEALNITGIVVKIKEINYF